MIELVDQTGQLSPAEGAAMEGAALAALALEGKTGELTILVAGAEEIRALNRDYRGIDRVTDVLSYPAEEGESIFAPPGYWGDIMVCLSRAREQAEEYGHSLIRELCFLTVHGTLHLLGYDHMKAEDEREMLSRQKRVMERIEIER